jgi:prepilin-type N-terminal cleavage/methylation domain-containing protein
MKKFNKNKKYSGFTLIEMSIVLLIISSMIGGGLMFFNEYRAKNKRQETFQKMHTIVEAIKKFSQTYDRLPCPADISYNSVAGGWSEYGVSPVVADCVDNATYTTGKIIISGMVPFKTIGLSEEYATDGWGNRIRYVIGVGNARDSVLAQDGGSGDEFTFANFGFNSDSRNAYGLSSGKLFVLLSHGENGIGARGARGQISTTYNLASEGNLDTNSNASAPGGSTAGLDRDIANAISANEIDDMREDPSAYYYVGAPFNGFDDIVMGLNYEDLMSTGLGGSTGSSGRGTSGTTYSNLTYTGKGGCENLENMTHVSTGSVFIRIISYDCNARTIVLETALPEGVTSTKSSPDGITCCYAPGIFYNQ